MKNLEKKPFMVYSFKIDGDLYQVWDHDKFTSRMEQTFTWTKNGVDKTQEEFGSEHGALFNILAHMSEEWDVGCRK